MAGTAQIFGKLEQEPVGIITDLERDRRKIALGIEHRDPPHHINDTCPFPIMKGTPDAHHLEVYPNFSITVFASGPFKKARKAFAASFCAPFRKSTAS